MPNGANILVGYAYFPGTSSNFIDADPPTGNPNLHKMLEGWDVRFKVMIDDVTPVVANQIISKGDSTTNGRGWGITDETHATDGSSRIINGWSTDGTSGGNLSAQSAATGQVDGVAFTWRVWFVPNDGSGNRITRHYRSLDYDFNTRSGTWTLVSSTTGPSTVINPNSAGKLEFGSRFNGTGLLLFGKEYAVQVLHPVTSELLVDFRPDLQSYGLVSWTDQIGNTYTVHSTNPVTPVGIIRPIDIMDVEEEETGCKLVAKVFIPDGFVTGTGTLVRGGLLGTDWITVPAGDDGVYFPLSELPAASAFYSIFGELGGTNLPDSIRRPYTVQVRTVWKPTNADGTTNLTTPPDLSVYATCKSQFESAPRISYSRDSAFLHGGFLSSGKWYTSSEAPSVAANSSIAAVKSSSTANAIDSFNREISEIRIEGISSTNGWDLSAIRLPKSAGSSLNSYGSLGRFEYEDSDGFSASFAIDGDDHRILATFAWPDSNSSTYSINISAGATRVYDVATQSNLSYANWTKISGTRVVTWNSIEFKTPSQVYAEFPESSQIADELDTRHGTGSWQRLAVSASLSVAEGIAVQGATLRGRAGYTFAPAPFELVGDDSAGWTQYVFSVKVDADKDDENNALILIRESNPSAGDDGMMRQNGRRPQSNADASISVNVAGGNTIVTVFITARGMNVPTSSGDGYAFSLVRWAGAVKEEIASGNMVVSRTAYRDPVAP